VGFSDRLRSWLRGESGGRAPGPSTDKPSKGATRELEEFVRSRNGVEAYLEPRTAIYADTVLLIADDGEYLRRTIAGRDQARAFASKVKIPLYDAAKVG
jgi:hypothetical protein